LARILIDDATSVRQKIRASNAILSYKVDPEVAAFTRCYLESVCENSAVPADHRIWAGEILRKCEGAPRIMASIERIDSAPAPPVDPAAEREQLRLEFERKKAYVEAATAAIEREFGPQSRARQRAD
jgi:hypothetical protein